MLTLEGDGVEWGALVGQQDAVAEKRGLVAEGLLGGEPGELGGIV